MSARTNIDQATNDAPRGFGGEHSAPTPLGELLIGKGLLTPAQLSKALDAQQSEDGHRLLGEVLVEMGFIDEALIADVEAKIAALNLRLPGLEGKANKKERQQVNKEIYELESGLAQRPVAPLSSTTAPVGC